MFMLFVQADAALNAFLPPAGAVAVWAALGGAVSMALYRLVSPQRKIAALKADIKTAQKDLARYDGEFSGATALIRKSLGLSLRQIGFVLGPTLLAVIPVVYILFWCSHLYDYAMPRPGEEVFIHVPPFNAPPVVWPDDGEVFPLFDDKNLTLYTLPPPFPVPLRHKKQWWNLFLPNPLGYIPEESGVPEIRLEFKKRAVLDFGPAWARGWLAVFIMTLVAVSVALKIIFRIE